MSETTAIDTWLQTRLTTHSAMLTAFGSYTIQVAEGAAPDEWEYPFVVYQHQSSFDNNGVGPDARILVICKYVVRAIVRCDSYNHTVLKALAKGIDLALHGASGVVVDGHVLGCRRDNEYRLTEPADGRPIRHLGGTYTLWASAL